jgi:hypothetical protein
MKFLNAINPAKTIPNIWYLGWFMIGFMSTIFSVIILPLGSPHPYIDILYGLIGCVIIAYSLKPAIKYTPISLGCFVVIFGLMIISLGIELLIGYRTEIYHSIKSWFVISYIISLGSFISWVGIDFITRQMKKQ